MAARARREIEISEDIAFQRRSWQAQRVGRLLVFLLVGAALTGVVGGGGLANVTITAPDGTIAVEHRRVLRNHADAPLDVRVSGDSSVAAPLTLWLSRELVRSLDLERAVPATTKEWSEDGRVMLEFAPPPSGRGGEIRLHLRTRNPGRLEGELGVVGGGAVRLRFMVLP